MELVMVAAAVFGFVAIMRTPWLSAPQLVSAPVPYDVGPDEDDQQQPETDRAPRRPLPLLWAVASLAVLRLVAFVALGA